MNEQLLEALQSVSARFWSKVEKRDGGCWLWMAARSDKGYGTFGLNRIGVKMIRAHRVAWMLHNRQALDDAVMVLHCCDNPPCCNPDHLFLGDARINSKDAFSKGRLKCIGHGQEKPRQWSKITAKQAEYIRTCGKPVTRLMLELPLSRSQIFRIRQGIHWPARDIAHAVASVLVATKEATK